MGKLEKLIVAALLLAFLAIGIFLASPAGVALCNGYDYWIQKTDDATSYDTRKKVEDTCRAMQANYEADRLVYIQYKDSTDREKQGWAEQARMRANRTAASYNEYFLKNSFVWSGAVPADIRAELHYLE